MKKLVSKLTLKTDKITSLSKNQAQQLNGGRPSTPPYTVSCNCTTTTFIC